MEACIEVSAKERLVFEIACACFFLASDIE